MTKSEMAAAPQRGQRLRCPARGSSSISATRAWSCSTASANAVTEEDGDADTTIKVAWSDWQDMADGKLDGMTAFMQGKLKVEGDMSQRDAAAGRAGEASELGCIAIQRKHRSSRSP